MKPSPLSTRAVIFARNIPQGNYGQTGWITPTYKNGRRIKPHQYRFRADGSLFEVNIDPIFIFKSEDSYENGTEWKMA